MSIGPLRIRVMPLGKGYVAESESPAVTALGSSVHEAAENGRLMAMAAFEGFQYHAPPTTLIVRIDEPGRSVIAMQPLNQPFSLEAEEEENSLCRFESFLSS